MTLISAQQAAAYYDPEKSRGLRDDRRLPRRRGGHPAAEIAELIRLGCTYIQLDAPQYAALLDPALREGYRQRGNDPDRLLDAVSNWTTP